MFAELMMVYESWPFSMGLVESNVMNGHGGERERRVRLEVVPWSWGGPLDPTPNVTLLGDAPR